MTVFLNGTNGEGQKGSLLEELRDGGNEDEKWQGSSQLCSEEDEEEETKIVLQEFVDGFWCHVCATYWGSRTWNLSCSISRQKSLINEWESGECEPANPLTKSEYRSGAGFRQVFKLSRLLKKVLQRLPKGYIGLVYFGNPEATPLFKYIQKHFNFMSLEYQGAQYLALADPRVEAE